MTDKEHVAPAVLTEDYSKYGVTLKVLRFAGDDIQADKNLISNKYDVLTLLGVVDFVGISQAKIVVSRFVEKVPKPKDNAPLVWLLRGRFGEGHRCIVPCDDKGDPIVNGMKSGGNFAASDDLNFWHVVGGPFSAPVIYDRISPPGSDNDLNWGS